VGLVCPVTTTILLCLTNLIFCLWAFSQPHCCCNRPSPSFTASAGGLGASCHNYHPAMSDQSHLCLWVFSQHPCHCNRPSPSFPASAGGLGVSCHNYHQRRTTEEKCDVTYPLWISHSSPVSVPVVRPCGIPFLDVSTTWLCCNWYMRKYNENLWKCKNMILWTLKLLRNAANVCKQSTLPTVGEVGTRKSKQVKQSQYRLSTQLSD